VKHNGVVIPINSYGCIMRFSMLRFLFSDQLNQSSGQEKFPKSSRIGKEGREGSTISSATDQKPVRTANEACLYYLIKETQSVFQIFSLDLN